MNRCQAEGRKRSLSEASNALAYIAFWKFQNKKRHLVLLRIRSLAWNFRMNFHCLAQTSTKTLCWLLGLLELWWSLPFCAGFVLLESRPSLVQTSPCWFLLWFRPPQVRTTFPVRLNLPVSSRTSSSFILTFPCPLAPPCALKTSFLFDLDR